MQQISRVILSPPLIPTCAATLLVAAVLLLIERPSLHGIGAFAAVLLNGYLLW